jgi:hypothetical protein
MRNSLLLGYPIELLWNWLGWVTHPQENMEILLQHCRGQTFSKPLRDIWVSSFVITMILSSPVLVIFGIKITDLDYFAVYNVVLLFFYLLGAFGSHILLRVFRQKSRYDITFKIYTATFVYTPILSLFQLPRTYVLFSQIEWIKHSNLSIIEGFQKAQTMDFYKNHTIYEISQYLYSVSTVISLLITVIITEMIIQYGDYPLDDRSGLGGWKRYI